MKNINWKVRLQSGSWWMGIISAIVVAVFAILKICKVNVPVTADEIMNVAMLVLMIPAAIGITTDPTTKGVSDSQQALTYDTPKEDEEKGGEKMRFELKDTIEFMNSDDYKRRFIAEYMQAKIRYDKLDEMTVKYEAGTLDFTPNCPLEILKEQKKFLGNYIRILKIRAEIEKVEFPEV